MLIYLNNVCCPLALQAEELKMATQLTGPIMPIKNVSVTKSRSVCKTVVQGILFSLSSSRAWLSLDASHPGSGKTRNGSSLSLSLAKICSVPRCCRA